MIGGGELGVVALVVVVLIAIVVAGGLGLGLGLRLTRRRDREPTRETVDRPLPGRRDQVPDPLPPDDGEPGERAP